MVYHLCITGREVRLNVYLDGRGFLFTSGETPVTLMNFFLVSATLLIDLMEREGCVVWKMYMYYVTQAQPINIAGCNTNFTHSLDSV